MGVKKFLILSLGAILIALAIGYYQKIVNKDNPTNPSAIKQSDSTAENNEPISVIVENLDTPWALDFLPSGELLITERNGRLSILSGGQIKQIANIEKSKEFGEGGLMGIAVHPDFESNNFIYLYYTFSSDDQKTLNRVVRYKLSNNTLGNEQIIVDNIPGAVFHNGGRIKFGPDGNLYITTGDSNNPSLSQNRNSLAGKILRVTDEGLPATGNPFGSAQGKPSGDPRIFSYGHRNPQGIVWGDGNILFSTEHGRSGVLSGLDELNIIESGRNYGWPEIEGDEKREGMVTPIFNSGASDTWAPGGAAFFNGSLFFAGLRGSALYQFEVFTKSLSVHFKNEYGRLRDVILGPDNFLYITTSNRDGRGDPKANDDKIIRVDPQSL